MDKMQITIREDDHFQGHSVEAYDPGIQGGGGWLVPWFSEQQLPALIDVLNKIDPEHPASFDPISRKLRLWDYDPEHEGEERDANEMAYISHDPLLHDGIEYWELNWIWERA